jgi:putative transposase
MVGALLAAPFFETCQERTMPYDPDRHHRRSIRLQKYDYAQVGAYFVTFCVQDRECVLGEVTGDDVNLSDAGEMVAQVWDDLPSRFPGVELDAWVVMPNHVHAIVVIAGEVARQGAASSAPPLGQVMRTVKSVSAIACNRALDREGLPFWQRNYYERVIRDEEELNGIRRYIAENPTRWAEDPENPIHPGTRQSSEG